jgi:predicted dehydrogenase
MSQKLRIAMVGCGEISLANLKGIQNSGNTEVVMAMDSQLDLARSFAEQASAAYTTHYEDVLQSNEVDAVFICTPHNFHAPLGIRAARHGKHVIVEKPLATTLKDAKNLIQACNENHVKLSVPYIMRYTSHIKKAKDLIDIGAIGKIVAISIHWIAEKSESYWEGGFTGRSRSDWRISREKSGGGILIMNCIHLFDYIEFLTGLRPIKYLSQYDTFLTNVEVEDFFYGILRYDNGALCSIVAGSKMVGGCYPEEQRGVRLFGEYGQILLNKPDASLIFTNKNVNGIKTGTWDNIQSFASKEPKINNKEKKNPRSLFVKEFAQAILEKKDPPISGEVSYRSLETCIKLYNNKNSKVD